MHKSIKAVQVKKLNICFSGKVNNIWKINKTNLKQGLLPRHVQFIALAGMIGTGIFKGSSETLNMAGPSVVFAYLMGGLLLFIVMAALGEMGTVYPNLNVQTTGS